MRLLTLHIWWDCVFCNSHPAPPLAWWGRISTCCGNSPWAEYLAWLWLLVFSEVPIIPSLLLLPSGEPHKQPFTLIGEISHKQIRSNPERLWIARLHACGFLLPSEKSWCLLNKKIHAKRIAWQALQVYCKGSIPILRIEITIIILRIFKNI